MANHIANRMANRILIPKLGISRLGREEGISYGT